MEQMFGLPLSPYQYISKALKTELVQLAHLRMLHTG